MDRSYSDASTLPYFSMTSKIPNPNQLISIVCKYVNLCGNFTVKM